MCKSHLTANTATGGCVVGGRGISEGCDGAKGMHGATEGWSHGQTGDKGMHGAKGMNGSKGMRGAKRKHGAKSLSSLLSNTFVNNYYRSESKL